LQQLLLCFWIITINQTFNTHYDPRNKIASLLAISCSSRHTFICRCFWTFLESRGTNIASTQRVLKYILLRFPGELHNYSQWSGSTWIVPWQSSWIFSKFSIILLVLGHPESSSTSTDTWPALKSECHSKTAV
jgi:putative flippase GtrA